MPAIASANCPSAVNVSLVNRHLPPSRAAGLNSANGVDEKCRQSEQNGMWWEQFFELLLTGSLFCPLSGACAGNRAYDFSAKLRLTTSEVSGSIEPLNFAHLSNWDVLGAVSGRN